MEQVEKFKQMVDEAYEDYTNYPLATIQDYRTNILYQNKDKGWCKRNGRSVVSPHPTCHLTKDEFVNKCKTNSDFSQKWRLHIEERELSLRERFRLIGYSEKFYFIVEKAIQEQGEEFLKMKLNEAKIPTKVITTKYQNETIEIYE